MNCSGSRGKHWFSFLFGVRFAISFCAGLEAFFPSLQRERLQKANPAT